MIGYLFSTWYLTGKLIQLAGEWTENPTLEKFGNAISIPPSYAICHKIFYHKTLSKGCFGILSGFKPYSDIKKISKLPTELYNENYDKIFKINAFKKSLEYATRSHLEYIDVDKYLATLITKSYNLVKTQKTIVRESVEEFVHNAFSEVLPEQVDFLLLNLSYIPTIDPFFKGVENIIGEETAKDSGHLYFLYEYYG